MVLVLLQKQSFTLIHQQNNQQNTSGRQAQLTIVVVTLSVPPSPQPVQLSPQDLV